ncbi:hypothetical protein DEO23_11230 [Brachybacterium endophyticum]|uniref:Putative gluconeogenesis factor n=1 Tax=Brachybacterium endophyticum TaxID=2182385 RepID=A0A2U2RIR5_9MICO|nr:gluconeogenesis factor YvcK family protein [Brachybacterium endophyticum]PWH05769.1 hypothetical protein DEO23_11230 [Brachybacterium endophyticum]
MTSSRLPGLPPHLRHGPRRSLSAPRRVVAFGGGHGLAANLRSLRLLVDDITAVVTVADDGGSSGRIRGQLPVLPPGDLRMALAALCEDSDWGAFWHDAVQHRFATDGELDGHALGNLMIVAMWQILEDPIAGLDRIGELLGARGRVLPMALDPLDIEAEVVFADGTRSTVRGQAQVAEAPGRVETMRLIPERPRVPDEVVQAIHAADWVVVGPGSWYTSVLPHLQIPEIAEALRTTSAHRCVVMNLEAGGEEIEGMRSRDLLSVLLDAAPDTRFDTVIADPTALDDAVELAEFAHTRGIRTLLRQVSVAAGVPEHDPVRLAAAYRDVFDGVFGDIGQGAGAARSTGQNRRPGAEGESVVDNAPGTTQNREGTEDGTDR